MAKFDVGNYVCGNEDNGYTFTNHKSLCKVVRTDPLYVRVILTVSESIATHGTETYNVNEDKFTLTTYDSWVEQKQAAGETIYQRGGEKMIEGRKVVASMLSKAAIGDFRFDSEKENDIVKSCFDAIVPFFDRYGYVWNDDYVEDIIRTSIRNKGWIINLFRNHPNWDENKMMIRLSESFEKIEYGEAQTFTNWMREQAEKFLEKNEVKIHGFSYQDIRALTKHWDNTGRDRDYIKDMLARYQIIFEIISQKFRSDGKNIKASEETKEIYKIKESLRELDKMFDVSKTVLRPVLRDRVLEQNLQSIDGYYVTAETIDKYHKMMEVINLFSSHVAEKTLIKFIDQEFADRFNAIIPDLKLGNGLKLSKAIGRFCKWAGFDKVEEFKEVTHNGVTYSKDFGYKYRYPLFAEAVNPVEVKRPFIISINPVDFWLMSNGANWRSCQTLDVCGVDCVDSDNSHFGMYSSGTESYMLDEVTFIVYTIKENYEGDAYETQPKIIRNLFHMDEDKIVQGRLYPGSNDSERGFYMEVRNTIQKVVSDCLKVENYWELKKGVNECGEATYSRGTHYRDYVSHTGQCNVSYLKMVPKNRNKIVIGHDPICPNCGEEHSYEKNVLCEDCINDAQLYGVVCEECGDRFDPENDGVSFDDHHYCCCTCAENAGWVELEVRGWSTWCSTYDDEVHYSDYHSRYFHEESDDAIETIDGNWYMDSCETEANDYVWNEQEGAWIPSNEERKCCKCDQYFWNGSSYWNDDYHCCADCEDEVITEENEEEELQETA